ALLIVQLSSSQAPAPTDPFAAGGCPPGTTEDNSGEPSEEVRGCLDAGGTFTGPYVKRRYGEIRAAGEYQQSQPNGRWYTFDGEIVEIADYDHGKSNGERRHYLALSGELVLQQHYENGTLEGPAMERDGRLKLVGQYLKGQKRGEWKIYDGPEGELLRIDD